MIPPSITTLMHDFAGLSQEHSSNSPPDTRTPLYHACRCFRKPGAMKIVACLFLMAFTALFLSQCTSRSGSTVARDQQKAFQTLIEFLESLHSGDYEEAIRLYGGTYETMMSHNPHIPSDNLAALLRNACTINGAQCLQVMRIEPHQAVSEREFHFQVAFMLPDGSLLSIPRQPEDSGANSQPQTLFLFRVKKVADGRFVVLDMPPYAP